MNPKMRWIVVVAALAVPVAVWAQHRATPVAPAVESAPPAPAPSPAVDPAPDDDLELAELMALGFDEELLADMGDGGEPDDARIVDRRERRIVGRPGMRARHRMGGGMFGHDGPGMRARWAELGLSDDQRTKLQALRGAQARKAVQRRADMQLARLDLHQLMRSERPNTASVNSQIDKLARLHAEGMKARFETHMQSRALLTPEQVKKLREGMPGVHHEMGDFD